MTHLRALDLFCCAGGATKGLQRAGFHVTGVDINPQPHYCGDEFHQADALTFPLDGFDFIWASPPCQRYTLAQRIQANEHPDLIDPIRQRLKQRGLPYAIENVPGAPLLEPITLCGAMFGIRTYRHRNFETSFFAEAPPHPEHVAPLRKMGRRVQPGEFMHIVGNFSGAALAREIMGMPWATRDELREAIPPAYSEFIGRAAIAHIEALPHLDRAGVLEHAGDYSPVAILTSLLRVTEQTVEITNGPFKALYQLQAKALAAALRALAQPAVNTSPEGVSVSGKNEHVPEGVGGWQPIETAPKDGKDDILLFVSEYPTRVGILRDIITLGTWSTETEAWDVPLLSFENDVGFGVFSHWQPLPAIPSPTDERSK